MSFSLNDPFNVTRPMMKRFQGTPLGDAMDTLGNNKAFNYLTAGPMAALPDSQQLQPSPWMDMKQVEAQDQKNQLAQMAKAYGAYANSDS